MLVRRQLSPIRAIQRQRAFILWHPPGLAFARPIARDRVTNHVSLLGARRFVPLFATQTLGAFNDNLFKSAFVMLVTYGTTIESALDPGLLAALAGGALIAPYFLFCATAGELADRFERARLLQILKAAELLAVLGSVA